MTVPSQEMATFLGNHLDQVLQQSGQAFIKTVAAVQPFRAGCTLMDILNMVESVQDRIRTQLERNTKSSDKKDIGNEVKVCLHLPTPFSMKNAPPHPLEKARYFEGVESRFSMGQ